MIHVGNYDPAANDIPGINWSYTYPLTVQLIDNKNKLFNSFRSDLLCILPVGQEDEDRSQVYE